MGEVYTFDLNEEVKREHVFYNNRYGIKCAADLYTPKGLDRKGQYPAVVIGPPYAGTKEQGPGIYADQMAQRGYIALAFDPVFMGESGGEPRHVSSPELFSEGFSAGVDFAGMLPYVDREKISAIGICGSGGFALSAAQVDTRIKAVVTTSMFDTTQAARMMSDEDILAAKKRLSAKRWEDFAKQGAEYNPTFPEFPVEEIPEGLDPISAEFFSYYGTTRGHFAGALGGFTTTSDLAMMQFRLLDYIKEISPRPIMMIIGEKALTSIFTETAFKNAAEPKELVVVPNANHVDLYDDVTKIPFGKIDKFLRDAFKRQEADNENN